MCCIFMISLNNRRWSCSQKYVFKKLLSPVMCLFHPINDRPKISHLDTLGNKTAAVSSVLSKHRFCWGPLSPAAVLPPHLPRTVWLRQPSQESGGTDWLCVHYPETLYLHWCSAEKTRIENHKTYTHTQCLPAHTVPLASHCAGVNIARKFTRALASQ